MKSKRRGFVSIILVALVCLVIAMPVQGAVSYSKQCDTEWMYDIWGYHKDQEYDGNDWDPMSNSSHGARFWQHMDDVNISLEILLINDHDGLQKTLDFEYTVEVGCMGSSGYKIIEGASSSTNNQYQNTVSVDYQASDDRDLYIEVYDVTWTAMIQLSITVKVLDGEEILGWQVLMYEWVGPVE